VYEIFEHYSVDRASAAPALAALKQNPTAWVDFMMRFELGLEEPARNRAHRSALTIAASYIAGGIIPLLPYMLIHDSLEALELSVVITLLALAVFGALKGKLVGTGWLRSALQTITIGGAAISLLVVVLRRVFAKMLKRKGKVQASAPTTLPPGDGDVDAEMETHRAQLAEQAALQAQLDAAALREATKKSAVLVKRLRENINKDATLSTHIVRSWLNEGS